jgi:hypothetical protein
MRSTAGSMAKGASGESSKVGDAKHDPVDCAAALLDILEEQAGFN